MKRIALSIIAFLLLVIPANAATRFWVGGTGTWDAATTTHWAATTGGAGGQTVPTSADTVTFDGSSGGGTVTVNFGGTVTVQSITMGAFTGTLDFSANNNSVTLSGAPGFTGSGAGTRTLNLGNGTWTLNSTVSSTLWNMTTTTGLTFNANSSVISFTGNAGARIMITGNLTYATISIGALGASGGSVNINTTGPTTIATISATAPTNILFTASNVTTITNAFTWTGTSANNISVQSATGGSVATVSTASGSPTMSWAAVKDMTFQGGATFTATNSLDNKGNTGITITAPATGGGGHIIGG